MCFGVDYLENILFKMEDCFTPLKWKSLHTHTHTRTHTHTHTHTHTGGTQESLAVAATGAVKTITQEAENVKLAATALGSDDMEAQLLLLTAVKDVTNALGDLIGSTRAAAGKSHTDPSMEKLKTSAKVCIK